MTFANIITLTRIGLIPLFALSVLYYADGVKKDIPVFWQYACTLLLFVVISVADGLDGYVARKYNQKTKLGSILDPLADKTLLVTSLIILSINPAHAFPQLPMWFPIVILSRDALLVMGVVVIFIMGKSLEVKPHLIGKIATAFQMLTIGMVLLRVEERHLAIPVWIAGICTAISGVIYIVQGSKRLSA